MAASEGRHKPPAHCMPPGRVVPALCLMRLSGRLLLAGIVATLLVGCRPTIGSINANPAKYYEEQVTVRARVSRRQIVGDQALLELADAGERRILALLPAADAPPVGDWVKVRGVLVADRRVGGVTVYDVVVAEDVGGAREKPWWRFW